jgi:trehalose/maltose hydrolase-like predicted phosphorylase
MAPRYFRQTAAIDLADTHVWQLMWGVHIAALGGVWLTAVFGFAGLSMHGDGIAFRSTAAGELAQPRFHTSVAHSPPQSQDRAGQANPRSNAGNR